jgi:PiT family inorganic phosphate transporter
MEDCENYGYPHHKVTPFEGVAAETAGAHHFIHNGSNENSCEHNSYYYGFDYRRGSYQKIVCGSWGVTVNLLWAWILTIPVSGALAALVYALVHLVL